MKLIAVGIAALLSASPTVVSHIDDDRIKESSGLAHSVKHPDLVYTMNDSGNRPVVYAIQASTGKVVGETDLSSFDLEDPESIAVDPRGRLWLGDLGDNDRDRDDVSILSFEEPGPGQAAPRSLQRYPVTFDSGPSNVEAMLVYPTTGQILLISKKNEDGGKPNLFALPQTLRADEPNVATNLNRAMPAGVSDATFSPDGRHALVETASKVLVYDVTTWESVGEFPTPDLPKGESMTIEPGGASVLMGTEGEASPLIRVNLPAVALPSSAPTSAASAPANTADNGVTAGPAAIPPGELTGPNMAPAEPEPVSRVSVALVVGALVLVAGIAIGRFVQRRRRLVHRHRRLAEHDRR